MPAGLCQPSLSIQWRSAVAEKATSVELARSKGHATGPWASHVLCHVFVSNSKATMHFGRGWPLLSMPNSKSITTREVGLCMVLLPTQSPDHGVVGRRYQAIAKRRGDEIIQGLVRPLRSPLLTDCGKEFIRIFALVGLYTPPLGPGLFDDSLSRRLPRRRMSRNRP